MAPSSFSILFFLIFFTLLTPSFSEQPITHIMHTSIAELPSAFSCPHQWYLSALSSVHGLPPSHMQPHHLPIYVYTSASHGFAAKLTPSQAATLLQTPGFLAAYPDSSSHLHTTRTPEFMQLNSKTGLWPSSHYGNDVILGIFDTGVWPERRSFSDRRLGPVPARWKGLCESGTAFNASFCNKKLIGARSFFKGYEAASGPINETVEYKSARDIDGHGTHTASTAAGRHVYRASLMGNAAGTAKGVASRARIAVYKVCWVGGCFNSDILAAFDKAIADGVDVISLSVGGSVVPYFLDTIAVGSFAAMQQGIVVSCSAGNAGPTPQSVTNVAPWILTVAASTVDRDFPSPVTLGNGASYAGVSLYRGKGFGTMQRRLVYAGDAALYANSSASLCMMGTLNPKLVHGKIVLCDRGVNARVQKGAVVLSAGGLGMILANAAENGEELTADSHLLPATLVGYREGLAIKLYIARSKRPTATISFQGTKLGIKPAPVMAAFSSRGPNPVTPEILKPDITAPGVNILAAWTDAIGPSGQAGDKRIVEFNILSGTSMSCPHVSGLAALLKGAYPKWSPAAIKSALMTTAVTVDNEGHSLMDGATLRPSTPFCHGAGHVNPQAALDPGLVYDIGIDDYIEFICTLNYTGRTARMFTQGKHRCKQGGSPGDLNYPSFSVVFDQNGNFSRRYEATFRRTVTNVGWANSTYKVKVNAPRGMRVSVYPQVLYFKKRNQKLSYIVKFGARSLKLKEGSEYISSYGSIVWSDGSHSVYSPIVFTWNR